MRVGEAEEREETLHAARVTGRRQEQAENRHRRFE
jgi:hypothetical protein